LERYHWPKGCQWKGINGPYEENANYDPQLVWSFWGDPAYGNDRPRTVFTHDIFTGGSMSGEGAAAGVFGHYDFLRHDKWMRFVKRAWPSIDNPDKLGYVGWWVYDIELDLWNIVGVVSMPCKVRGISGASCFIESTAGDKESRRIIDRRVGYDRLNGKWQKMDTIKVIGQAPEDAFEIIEDGTVLRFDSKVWKKWNEPDTVKVPTPTFTLTAKTPDQPTLDTPEVKNVKASQLENNMVVQWTVPGDATPQFSYRIEAYAGAHATGVVLATVEKRLPHINVVNLKVPGKARSVRLTLYDIFDQPVTRIIPVEIEEAIPAVEKDGLRKGLRVKYYEAAAGVEWKVIPDMSELTPIREGIVNELEDTSKLERTQQYAFTYDGFININKTGMYILQPETMDGSKIYIDGKLVADRDGMHSPAIRRYSAPLEAGLHVIKIDYFKGAGRGPRYKLRLSIEGPDLAMTVLGREDFQYADDALTPRIALNPQAPGSEKGNRFTITPDIDMKGQELKRVEFFQGNNRLGIYFSDKEAETPKTPEYTTLIASGENW
jgi:hypothetical protein